MYGIGSMNSLEFSPDIHFLSLPAVLLPALPSNSLGKAWFIDRWLISHNVTSVKGHMIKWMQQRVRDQRPIRVLWWPMEGPVTTGLTNIVSKGSHSKYCRLHMPWGPCCTYWLSWAAMISAGWRGHRSISHYRHCQRKQRMCNFSSYGLIKGRQSRAQTSLEWMSGSPTGM